MARPNPDRRPPAAPTPSDAKSDAARPVDLSRLRIDRRGESGPRVRGFPWLRVLGLLAIAGILFLYREPLLGIVSGAPGTEVKTGRAVRVGPGVAAAGQVASNGYVVADRTASLATVLSGLLVELNVKEGDRVKAKQVLARIQYDDFEAEQARAQRALAVVSARVEAARAERKAAGQQIPRMEAELETLGELVTQAQVTKERLDREVTRNAPLKEQKRIDDATWDRIQTEARLAALALSTARKRMATTEATLAQWREQLVSLDSQVVVVQAEVLAAEQAVRIAEIQVEKTKIIAPFDGVVIRKDAEPGEVIAPTGAGNSRGSVVTIVDPTSFEIQVELSERRLNKVAEGDRATIVLEADADHALRGVVRKIWPRAERSKGTVELRIALDEIPDILRPDMAARVTFEGKVDPDADQGAPEAYVTAPRAAIVTRGPSSHVFVISNDTVERRPVTLGESRGLTVVIESGLEGGETLVLSPPSSLEDGARVRVEGAR